MISLGLISEPFLNSSRRRMVEELRKELSARYDVVEREIVINTRSFNISMVRDVNALVDSIDPATFAVDERLPYWAELWPASIGLAEYILDCPGLSGKRILELGCGLGLAGIAAATAGASVVLTDYEDDALLFAAWNVARNLGLRAFHESVTLRNVDWREPGEPGVFDLVVGADLLYEARNFQPLIAVLRRVLTPGGYAIFTDPDRVVAKGFVGLARASGFCVDEHSKRVLYRDRASTVVCYTIRAGANDSTRKDVR